MYIYIYIYIYIFIYIYVCMYVFRYRWFQPFSIGYNYFHRLPNILSLLTDKTFTHKLSTAALQNSAHKTTFNVIQ